MVIYLITADNEVHGENLIEEQFQARLEPPRVRRKYVQVHNTIRKTEN